MVVMCASQGNFDPRLLVASAADGSSLADDAARVDAAARAMLAEARLRNTL